MRKAEKRVTKRDLDLRACRRALSASLADLEKLRAELYLYKQTCSSLEEIKSWWVNKARQLTLDLQFTRESLLAARAKRSSRRARFDRDGSRGK